MEIENRTKFYLFLDETVDHSLSSNSMNSDSVFGLAGILCRKTDYINIISPAVNGLKEKYWPPKGTYRGEPVILHSYDIRNSKGPFSDSALFSSYRKQDLIHDIGSLIDKLPIKVFGVLIKKDILDKRYSHPNDPYELSLEFIMERVLYHVKRENGIVKIFAESRGKNEDKKLQYKYLAVLEEGTFYVGNRELNKVFYKKSIKFLRKSANSEGLQLADLCVYPLRSYLKNHHSDRAWNIVKQKLYCDKRGNFHGRGLKIFPE